MRKVVLGLIILTLFTLGCRKDRFINVYLENSSETIPVLTVATYINGSYYNTIRVKKNTSAINWANYQLLLPSNKDSVQIMFVIPENNCRTACILLRDSLTSRSWMHVNYNEVLFRKGDQYYGYILSKDTVVEKNFYCEVTNNKRY